MIKINCQVISKKLYDHLMTRIRCLANLRKGDFTESWRSRGWPFDRLLAALTAVVSSMNLLPSPTYNHYREQAGRLGDLHQECWYFSLTLKIGLPWRISSLRISRDSRVNARIHIARIPPESNPNYTQVEVEEGTKILNKDLRKELEARYWRRERFKSGLNVCGEMHKESDA